MMVLFSFKVSVRLVLVLVYHASLFFMKFCSISVKMICFYVTSHVPTAMENINAYHSSVFINHVFSKGWLYLDLG